MPRHQYPKGHPKPPNSGRKAGTQNKQTVEVRNLLEECCKEIGGLKRLVKWVKSDIEHETIFWSSMYMRLLPLHVQGSGPGGELVITIKRDELAQRLQERGLPLTVFGSKAPTLELAANKGNGSDGQAEQDGSNPRAAGNGRDQEREE